LFVVITFLPSACAHGHGVSGEEAGVNEKTHPGKKKKKKKEAKAKQGVAPSSWHW
jgi:hypothetical protein